MRKARPPLARASGDLSVMRSIGLPSVGRESPQASSLTQVSSNVLKSATQSELRSSRPTACFSRGSARDHVLLGPAADDVAHRKNAAKVAAVDNEQVPKASLDHRLRRPL